MSPWIKLWVPFALVLASCGADPTEIVLVIDSDLGTTGLPRVDIQVLGPSMLEEVSTTIDFREPGSPPPYPLTLGLVRDPSAPNSSLAVNITGQDDSGRVVRASARTEFIAEESRALVLRLDAVCFDVPCAEGATCREGVCVDDIVLGDDLPPSDGF